MLYKVNQREQSQPKRTHQRLCLALKIMRLLLFDELKRVAKFYREAYNTKMPIFGKVMEAEVEVL